MVLLQPLLWFLFMMPMVTLILTEGSDWNVNDGNPYGTMMMNRYNQSKSTSVDANVYVQIEPIKNLKFKTVFAVNYGGSDYRSYSPVYKFTPQSGNAESLR